MKKQLLLFIAILASLQINAQSVLTVGADTKSITTEQAGQYDRINDEWTFASGKAYLIALPAQLDGYYFGQDAKRVKVTSLEKKDDGTYLAGVADMADLDDFLPNELYIITPTTSIESIIHITPGIKTDAVATPTDKELMHVDGDKVIMGIKSVLMDNVEGKAAVYDLQGRVVSDLRKGETYIINGKKVMVK